MADNYDKMARAIITLHKLDKKDYEIPQILIEGALENLIEALSTGNKAQAAKESKIVDQLIDGIHDSVLPDKTKEALKKKVKADVKKMVSPAKKKKATFNLGKSMAKHKTAVAKMFGLAKKGKKKETETSMRDLHKLLKKEGDVPDDMDLKAFEKELRKDKRFAEQLDNFSDPKGNPRGKKK